MTNKMENPLPMTPLSLFSLSLSRASREVFRGTPDSFQESVLSSTISSRRFSASVPQILLHSGSAFLILIKISQYSMRSDG